MGTHVTNEARRQRAGLCLSAATLPLMVDLTTPAVSVLMAVVDEELHLAEAVQRVLAQDYPGAIEVVLAVGPSSDRTLEVAEGLAHEDARVMVVENPTGRTPAGLNAAIAKSSHDVIVRVDGHGMLGPGYITTAVALLEETGADNVGGVMAAEGSTPFESAVAAAMTSKLGVGAASFHVGGEAGPAQTVYLGVFRRTTLERLGGYDESFARAQDWELNHRIRSAGGLVWFSPELNVSYRPRQTLKRLARQYFEYGRWRREVMRRYPETISPRYLAPPVALVGVAGGIVLGALGVKVGWLAPLGYAALVLGGSAWVGRDLDAASAVRLPLVVATMHGSWAIGFLTSPAGLRDPL
jgi:succinoglycan biosynthesis protein ExoA